MFVKEKKINFVKGGSGSYTTRVILPVEWVRHLGITREDSEIKLELIDHKIIIEKLNK